MVDISIPQPGDRGDEASPESLVAGRKVMERVIEAMGGQDRIARIDHIKSTGTQKIRILGDETAMRRTTILSLPDSLRIETDGPKGRSVRVWNGQAGYVKLEGSDRQAMHKDMIRSFKDDMSRMPFIIARRAMMGDLEAQLLGSAEVEGTMLDILQVQTRDTKPFRIYVEQESGRLVKVSYHTRTWEGEVAQTEKRFLDHREVNDVMVPYRMIWIQKGAEVGDLQLEEVEVNPDLADGLFDVAG
jgi:hypothetical protein